MIIQLKILIDIRMVTVSGVDEMTGTDTFVFVSYHNTLNICTAHVFAQMERDKCRHSRMTSLSAQMEVNNEYIRDVFKKNTHNILILMEKYSNVVSVFVWLFLLER